MLTREKTNSTSPASLDAWLFVSGAYWSMVEDVGHSDVAMSVAIWICRSSKSLGAGTRRDAVVARKIGTAAVNRSHASLSVWTNGSGTRNEREGP